MKKGKWIAITAVCIIAMFTLPLFGCSSKGGTTTKSSEQKSEPPQIYEIKYCMQDTSQDPRVTVIAEAEKKWLWEKSGGRIKLNIIPNAAAVTSPADIFDAVRTGVIEMGIQSSSRIAGRFTLMDVLSLPGISNYPGCLETTMAARALYAKYPEIQAEFKGVKVLSFNSVARTLLYSTKKPIKTVDDLKGRLIRAAGEYCIMGVKALGASPVSTPPSEWADGALKGVYDTIALNHQALYAMNLQELFKYVTDFNIQHSYFIQVMNEDFYKSLPADLQQLFSWENWEKDALIYGGKGDADEMALKQKFEEALAKKGLPPVYKPAAEEVAKLNAKLAPVREQWVKNNSAKGPAQAILDDYIALSKKYSYENFKPDWQSILNEWSSYPNVPQK
ncbi:MAG: TRAP transporter substrate-binding protein DctP [Peptococcaceae bacterium]|jgi:TRAP-type C4-dicarboxylate transport system substrate-binding protein|nr:TRAP transporter substrate-binding protein DctP [Peptococcaceae bacterium]MDH7525964.1 TRAP transporter substrate-binding protein DctP [Peptococcaceae bacterium]